MTNEELLAEIQTQQELMIAVATGKLRIEAVDAEYRQRRSRIRQELNKRDLTDPNPHVDLWRWYSKWSTDLPRYQDRRIYVRELYDALQESLNNAGAQEQSGHSIAVPDAFTALAARTTHLQRELLTVILDHFRREGEWILVRLLRLLPASGDKATIRAALEELGGAVVYEDGYAPNARYELTLLGVLLSNRGSDTESLLNRYLSHVRERYLADPRISEFRSTEVQQALALTDDETSFLGFLVRSGQFWSGGGYGPDSWSAQIPTDIDDFPAKTDFLAYIHFRAMQHYVPGIPTDVISRQQHYARQLQAPTVLLQTSTAQTGQASVKAAVPQKCFVLMPFGEPFDSRYTAVIKRAVKAAGLRSVRADDITKPGSITRQIWRELHEARVCLAELTGLNPNVMYELGLAHALRRPVVQITQDVKTLPFDLRDQRHIEYRTEDPKWAAKLRREITGMLMEVLADHEAAIVFDRVDDYRHGEQ